MKQFWIYVIFSFSVINVIAQNTNIRSTNPNISVIGDFQGSYTSNEDRKVDLYLNEVEIALNATVDPYARADFFLGFHREEYSKEFHAALEEAYVTSLALPAGLQIKAGRFRNSFGKSNLIHPHAKGYIDNPKVLENYFGEALIDEGISINWLIPNPLDFYQDLTIEITRGTEGTSFTISETNQLVFVGHLKNFWDITDNSTLEVGLSGASGSDDHYFTTKLAGLDFTYKWKPLRFNTYQSFEFQSELLWSRMKISPTKKIHPIGMYFYTSYQMAQRWFLRGRFDYSNLPYNDKWVERGFSGIIGWNATEFQKIELQVKHASSNNFDPYNQILIRSIFVIGAHGAHQY